MVNLVSINGRPVGLHKTQESHMNLCMVYSCSAGHREPVLLWPSLGRNSSRPPPRERASQSCSPSWCSSGCVGPLTPVTQASQVRAALPCMVQNEARYAHSVWYVQAVGAGKLSRLPILYQVGITIASHTLLYPPTPWSQLLAPVLQRTALFLLVHCILITGVMLGMPRLLNLACNDAELSAMVERYMMYVIPGVFLEALSRPLSRILVAQRVAAPLMAISLIKVPLNMAINYL